MQTAAEVRQAKRRPRVSLLNGLLLLTCAALWFGLYGARRANDLLSADNKRLEAENLSHRDALGLFDVTDPRLIHAIRVPTDDDEPRAYRVYLPPGNRYVLRYRANRVPVQGFPDVSTPISVEPGSHVIKVRLRRNHLPGTFQPLRSVKVRLDVEPQDGQKSSSTGAGIGIGEAQNDWIINRETGETAYGWREIGRTLETQPADEALVLYRARAHEVVVSARDSEGKPTSWTTKDIEGACDGFMVWIESIE